MLYIAIRYLLLASYIRQNSSRDFHSYKSFRIATLFQWGNNCLKFKQDAWKDGGAKYIIILSKT